MPSFWNGPQLYKLEMEIRAFNLSPRRTQGAVEEAIRVMGRLIKIERHRRGCVFKLSVLLILLSVVGSYPGWLSLATKWKPHTLLKKKKIVIIVLRNKYSTLNKAKIDLAFQGLTWEELKLSAQILWC